MKKITLTEAQKAQIRAALAAVHDDNGHFDIEVSFGNLTVVAKGYIEVETAVEDDYLNGTGACYELSRYASVELTGWLEDPETGDEDEVLVNDDNDAYDYLNAA